MQHRVLGLGRRFAPDARDGKFSVSSRLTTPAKDLRASRYWNANGWWGDQGQTSECVAFAWTHWLEDGPVTQPGKGPIVEPDDLYDAARKVDEWPGEDYDGTSVRAGAKVLKARGFVSAYHWATTVEQMAATIIELGPMVVGTNWYTGMDDIDEVGFLRVDGKVEGGHAWLVNGVHIKHALFRMKNSWGRGWGNRGMALVSFEDMERLLREDGEACIASEIRAS